MSPHLFTFLPLMLPLASAGFLVVGVLMTVRALREGAPVVRRLWIAHRLTNTDSGEATGRVLFSEMNRRTTSDGFELEVLETISFRTAEGTAVEGLPAFVDISSEDRTGLEVRVFYDRRRPERFIAPADGQGVDWKRHVEGLGGLLLQVAIGLAITIFTVQIVVPMLLEFF